ncbi:glycosyltransferase [Ruminococcus sp. AF21-3]|nr:glycosyltransferase [Ruminococcus sp. AF21-3]
MFRLWTKKVIYVSALDASIAKKLHSECTAIFDNISLGVDLPTEEQISEPISNSIVFSGVMDYGPNEDAAFYFASEVFPRIKNRVKNARFVIAGKNPTRLLMGLSSDCIHITGFVEDMYKTITNSEIYVSPLRYGSGTKNKVLEAMAAGMPVFLTAVSREGIDGLVDGYNCIFIDENNIVDKICNWLNNKDELDAIAKNGKEYVEKNHSWNDSFDKFLLD